LILQGLRQHLCFLKNNLRSFFVFIGSMRIPQISEFKMVTELVKLEK